MAEEDPVGGTKGCRRESGETWPKCLGGVESVNVRVNCRGGGGWGNKRSWGGVWVWRAETWIAGVGQRTVVGWWGVGVREVDCEVGGKGCEREREGEGRGAFCVGGIMERKRGGGEWGYREYISQGKTNPKMREIEGR